MTRFTPGAEWSVEHSGFPLLMLPGQLLGDAHDSWTHGSPALKDHQPFCVHRASLGWWSQPFNAVAHLTCTDLVLSGVLNPTEAVQLVLGVIEGVIN